MCKTESGMSLNDTGSPVWWVLCDNLEGWGRRQGRQAQDGRDMYVMICTGVRQKPTQSCKAIFHQLKNKFKNFKGN